MPPIDPPLITVMVGANLPVMIMLFEDSERFSEEQLIDHLTAEIRHLPHRDRCEMAHSTFHAEKVEHETAFDYRKIGRLLATHFELKLPTLTRGFVLHPKLQIA